MGKSFNIKNFNLWSGKEKFFNENQIEQQTITEHFPLLEKKCVVRHLEEGLKISDSYKIFFISLTSVSIKMKLMQCQVSLICKQLILRFHKSKQLCRNVTRSSRGKMTWSQTKPVIQGKILYGPNNT